MGSPSKKKQKLDIIENIEIYSADGFDYYIAKNNLPEDTGTVSLVVKAGFLCEEERVAGVAHLLEHVLLRGVVKATDSLFAQHRFSHKHHQTSQSYTIFSFQVHDEFEFSEAMRMLNMIAKRQVPITEEHVELEKKIVRMEYVTKFQSTSQIASDSFQSQLFQTSTIETCKKKLTMIKSSDLTKFYSNWYVPSQMAFIVTGGNFKKLLIEGSCPKKTLSNDYLPRAVPAPSWTRELEILNDNKEENFLVFKLQRSPDLLRNVVIKILLSATSRRLTSEGGFTRNICKGMDLYIVFQHGDVKRVVYEVFRLKQRGLTESEVERELKLVSRKMRRDAELFCLDERHQTVVVQNKVLDNFLFGFPIKSPESEFQLLEKQTTESLQALALDFLGLLKFEEARLYVQSSYSGSSWSNLLDGVNVENLYPWEDTEEVKLFEEHWSCEDMDPCSTKDYCILGMREFCLRNGMRILLCKSDNPPSKCHIEGFAHGGLSDVDENNFIPSFFGVYIVDQFCSFPLNFRLRGAEELKVLLGVNAYTRNIQAGFDVSDLEQCLQYIYLLFSQKPRLDLETDLQTRVRMAVNQWLERRKASDTVYGIATGYNVPSDVDPAGIDYQNATNFISSCFSNPADFTIVLAGDFDMDAAGNLVRKYMGSIPPVSSRNFPTDRNGITAVPVNFPTVRKKAVLANHTFKDVYICIPLKMDKQKQEEDTVYLDFLKVIVTHKLFRVLRHEMGEVYNIDGLIFFDGKTDYSAKSDVAFLLVSFSYDADGVMDWELVEKALKSIENLQCALSKEDITCLSFSTGPSTVRRKTVLEKAISSYQSSSYTGDVGKTMMEMDEFVQSIPTDDVNFWKDVFDKMMPDKCSERSISVVFQDRVVHVDEEFESDSDEEMDSDSDSDSDSDEDPLVLSFAEEGLSVVPPINSTSITTLDLRANSIKELPVTLSACSSLEVLILSENKINDWPADALRSLPTLTRLRFKNNPLNKIPSNGFEAVSRLKVLDLDDCVDSLLDNPSFASLQQLRELYLRRVNMQEVPSDIVLLRKLEILDLAQNSLRSIPEGFQNLTSMYILDLSDNHIETLPRELGGLSRSLSVLKLDGNPLSSIPETIVNGRTEDVLKYLKGQI